MDHFWETVSQLSCFQLIRGWQGKAEWQNANLLQRSKHKNPILSREKRAKYDKLSTQIE